MSRKFLSISAAVLISAYAFAAQAVVVQTPPKRSAAQEECMKENQQDHKGYLSCIHEKKMEKKNAEKGNSAGTPANNNAPGNPGQPADAPKYQ